MSRPRTLHDIVTHPMVQSTHTEDDGCFVDSRGRDIPGRWVYLHTGYICPPMECGTIHEPSVKACCELLAECRAMTIDEMQRSYDAPTIAALIRQGFTPTEVSS